MAAIVVTPADVLNVTGATVTTAQINTAKGTVSAVTGLDLDNVPAKATTRDLFLLTRAVIWQSAYDVSEDASRDRSVVSASANGASVTYAASSEDATEFGLSPFTSRYLARLSWRRHGGGIRTVHVTPEVLQVARAQDLINDDGYPPWRPL